MGQIPGAVVLQAIEDKALSRGIIGKSAPILAEIAYGKVRDNRNITHSIGFSGRWIASEGGGRSTLDFPLIRDAQSQDQP
jgi:hypothetical protein